MPRYLSVILVLVQCFFGFFVLAATVIEHLEDPDPAETSLFLGIALCFLITAAVICRTVMFQTKFRLWPGQRSMLLEQAGGRRTSAAVLAIAATVGCALGGALTWSIHQDTLDRRERRKAPPQAHELDDFVPDVASQLIDGTLWRLGDHFGEPVILHFWSSLENRSAGQMLKLRLLRDDLGDAAPSIVGVCSDRSDDFPQWWIDELGADWPQVFEPGLGNANSVVSTLDVRPWPGTVWVIGHEGRVVGKNLMGGDLSQQIHRALRRDRYIHQPAPELSTTTLGGHPWSLSEHRGTVVVLDFWATWCGPCKEETPHLMRVYERFSHRPDFELVGVSSDRNVDDLRAYCDSEQLPWVQLYDTDYAARRCISEAFEVSSIPSIWVIGRDGRVAAMEVRGEGIEAAVEAALGITPGDA